MHDWRIGKIPSVGMGWVDPAERGEELSGIQLKIEREAGCLQERFFNLDIGVVVVIEFENDVGESFEVRIHRTVERELDVPRIESALLRIVVSPFDVTEI